MTEQKTHGEWLVGLSFNPSNDPDVQKIKELYAEIVDLLYQKRQNAPALVYRFELYEKAMEHALTAQMWAVKAVTMRP